MINNFSPSLVFDIDGVCGYKTENFLVTKYIYLKGKIVETPRGFHLVFPGVAELFQVLFKRSIEFSFYSFGSKDRNEAFVKNIFKQIGFDDILANRVKIISDDKFEALTLPEQRQIHHQFGKQPSRVVKNLEFTFSEENKNLKDKIIIEDTWGNVPRCQIPNLLHITKTVSGTFEKFESKDNYDSAGLVDLKVKSLFTTEDLSGELKRVERAKEILIYRSTHTYKIAYLKLSDLSLVDEEITDEILLAELNKYFDNDLHQLCDLITSDDLNELIFSYVEERGGKAKKICRKANQIFYATGLIFTAMEKAQRQNKSFSEILFEMQYQPYQIPKTSHYEFGIYEDSPIEDQSESIVKEGQPYKDISYKLRIDDHYYWKGLAILQEVNQDLTLNNPLEYQLSLDTVITPAEVKIINTSLARKKVMVLK